MMLKKNLLHFKNAFIFDGMFRKETLVDISCCCVLSSVVLSEWTITSPAGASQEGVFVVGVYRTQSALSRLLERLISFPLVVTHHTRPLDFGDLRDFVTRKLVLKESWTQHVPFSGKATSNVEH